MSTLLLDGWFLRPERLLEAGFAFDFENIDAALTNIWL
jgi:NAD dependent epimerase/dehydratase family enzyme